MSKKNLITKSPWEKLRKFTNARIALGHAGESLPTSAHLAFQLDHAKARDAVHAPLDFNRLAEEISNLGLTPIQLQSRAISREDYLRKPNWGRRLDEASLKIWKNSANNNGAIEKKDILIVLGDGLSSRAIQSNGAKLLAALAKNFKSSLYPKIALVKHARVAIADELAAAANAKLVLILIGERPGLSSVENISVYLTYQAKVGTTDEARNCVSNIGGNSGLSIEQAANKLNYLIHQALKEKKSGLLLKDENQLQIIT